MVETSLRTFLTPKGHSDGFLTKDMNHYSGTWAHNSLLLCHFWCASKLGLLGTLISWHDWHTGRYSDWCLHTPMLWSDWCEIHTLKGQSDLCQIHTLMLWSNWYEQHISRYANIEFFFSLEKKTQYQKRYLQIRILKRN